MPTCNLQKRRVEVDITGTMVRWTMMRWTTMRCTKMRCTMMRCTMMRCAAQGKLSLCAITDHSLSATICPSPARTTLHRALRPLSVPFLLCQASSTAQVALGDRFSLFIQTLNIDQKPFNSILNSKTKSNYSFKEFIHSKTKSNYSFNELFIQTGQNNPACENS